MRAVHAYRKLLLWTTRWGHTKLCRKRILEAVSETEVGKKRIADYEVGLGRAMVEFSNPDQTGAVATREAPRAVHGEIIGSKRRVLGEDGHDGRTLAPSQLHACPPREGRYDRLQRSFTVREG